MGFVLCSVQDHHQYYNSSSYSIEDLTPYWVDMEVDPKVTVNAMLSQAHRRAAVSTVPEMSSSSHHNI